LSNLPLIQPTCWKYKKISYWTHKWPSSFAWCSLCDRELPDASSQSFCGIHVIVLLPEIKYKITWMLFHLHANHSDTCRSDRPVTHVYRKITSFSSRKTCLLPLLRPW
jgi:hypothetical protein